MLSGALVTQGIDVSVGQTQPSGTSVGVGSALLRWQAAKKSAVTKIVSSILVRINTSLGTVSDQNLRKSA
jgi:hypothetical protein